MIKNVKNFLISSYQSDTLAFWFEMIGSLSAIIASAGLAIYAQDPPMMAIYPFYLASSVLHVVAAVRRNAAWIAILSVYFTLINIYGILNLTVL